MSLLFGGKPEEVPLRRQILRVVVFAASKASTIAIISPVFKGDHCSAHMVNVGDDKKDLEEPLSPKEPQEEAIPRGANY